MKTECFNWKKRYEVHQTFHQSLANRITHFIATPIQLFGIIKLFTIFSFPLFNTALIVIAFLSFVYCMIHFKMGIAVSMYLISCWYIASHYPLTEQWYVDALFALSFIGFGAFIQVGVGHKIFERKNSNLSSEFDEFFQTYNPMIFVLIFFFPFLDMLHLQQPNKLSSTQNLSPE